ncbi:hypothetical protein IQ06DRAFT_347622 [Phaeosphaeriaceae sp. SRC1lsM3a]|nr:hypothetical protein IQ06DRAFT_347622 [Stagonospora sp. SRC1lsM3a]
MAVAAAQNSVDYPTLLSPLPSFLDRGSSGEFDRAEPLTHEKFVSNVAEKLGALDLSDDCQATGTKVSQVNGGQLVAKVMEWVDATKGQYFEPLAFVGAQHDDSTSESSDGHVCTPSAEAETKCTAKISMVELMHLLTECFQCQEQSVSILAHENTSQHTSATDAGGTNSPQSESRSRSAQSGRGSTQSSSSTTVLRSAPTSYRRMDDGEPPAKRPGDGQRSSARDMPSEPAYKSQMPCPMPETIACMGTNGTISEMLRSLQNRHRVIICTECCTKLDVPEQERKPENILKRHASTGCDRICISRECSGIKPSPAPYHRKTENCPNWKAISKEARWSFVWSLLNPGQEPPAPQFLSSVGYEHTNVRTPCRDRSSRERGLQLCKSVMEDLDAKNDRLQSLEQELEETRQQNLLKQQQSDDKIANLENIIETLLERLGDKNVDIPPSLRKRLARECPGCVIPLTSSKLQMPPTPASTPTRSVAAVLPECSTGNGGVILAAYSGHPDTTTRSQDAIIRSQQAERSFGELSAQSGPSHAMAGDVACEDMSFDDFMNRYGLDS